MTPTGPEAANQPAPANPARFDNEPVVLTERPELDVHDFLPLDPRLLRLRTVIALSAGLVFALVGLVLAVAVEPARWIGVFIALVAVAVTAVSVIGTRVSFRFWGYAVRGRDITVRHGVVLRSVTSVPFNRVQHVSVNSGPLERWLGLATIKVFTAGGVGADLSIEGLVASEAAILQDLILANVAEAGPSTATPTSPR